MRKPRLYSWKSWVKWENIVRLTCVIAIILLLTIITIKLTNPSFLTDVKLEILLIALGVAVLFPYITNFEALGVKVSVKEKVDDLTAWTKALPYYTLGSEYEGEGDLVLAEQYYLKSLNECPTFWPSLVAMGSLCQDYADRDKDPQEYSKAIMYYHRVLDLDKENVYSYNNLAALYANAPPQVRDLKQAVECADAALKIIPSFYDATYHRAEALNNVGDDKSYQEARRSLSVVKDEPEVGYYRHWILLELAVAESGLGTAVTPEKLDDMLELAERNSEGDDFLKYLSDPNAQVRFRESDRRTIGDFLKIHPPRASGAAAVRVRRH